VNSTVEDDVNFREEGAWEVCMFFTLR
jgi:hypothetical protein